MSVLIVPFSFTQHLQRALKIVNSNAGSYSEFLADCLASWCADRGIALRYIQPGHPNQNAFVERFNRTFRHEVLDAYVFESLDQMREISAEWMREYNEEPPMTRWTGCHRPSSGRTKRLEVLL